MNDVPIRDESIRLGQFLKLANLIDSGADAKAVIGDGMVRVNGEVETRRGRQLRDGDVVLVKCHISPYEAANIFNHEPLRERRLLLHKREIVRLASKIQRSSATCVPLTLYFKGARVKVEIALVTGKKLQDKRETIRRREADREARSAMKDARAPKR